MILHPMVFSYRVCVLCVCVFLCVCVCFCVCMCVCAPVYGKLFCNVMMPVLLFQELPSYC